MEIRNRLFPYPVLCDETDDYIEGFFDVEMISMESMNNLELTFDFKLENDDLENLIRKGQAKYVIHLECRYTSYRKVIKTDLKEIQCSIPKSRVNKEINIVAMIVATTEIEGYYSSLLNEDYLGEEINFEHAAILAYENMPKILISKNYEEALFKAFLGSGVDLPKHKKMIMTVKDSDKLDAVEVGKRFAALGYEIYATRNTCKTLQESGVPAKRVNKIEETHPNLLDLILGHQIDLIIDTPSQGIERSKDGFVIRRHAVETGVNCLTSLDTANALLTSLESSCREDLSLVDIAEIDKEIESKINES